MKTLFSFQVIWCDVLWYNAMVYRIYTNRSHHGRRKRNNCHDNIKPIHVKTKNNTHLIGISDTCLLVLRVCQVK